MSELSLSDVSLLITKGTTPTTIGAEFKNCGINFVKSESVGKHKYLDEAFFQYIDEVADKKLKRSRLMEGDLLFSIAGAYLGKLSIVRKKDIPANTNQAVGIVRLDKGKVNVDYLYYYFSQKNINIYINNLSSQSSQPNLNLSLLGNLKFINRPLLVQNQIAKVLSDLDAKIELNNRINAELESMAKLIYDYWFVQFDFPISAVQAEDMGKPELEGKPYKSSGGKMVYNEELKREVPEGWEVKELGEIEKNIVTGKTPSTSIPENFRGEVPFICIGDVRGNMHVIRTELTLTELGANSQAKKYIPEGAICVTCIASPGLVAFAAQPSQTNQQLNSIICKEFTNRYFLYFYLKDYFKYAKAKTGNTFANMNKGDFCSIKVIKPASQILETFSENLKPTIDKILINSKQNQQLSSLRDWLLPMLMNGQVKVREVAEDLSVAAESEVNYGG